MYLQTSRISLVLVISGQLDIRAEVFLRRDSIDRFRYYRKECLGDHFKGLSILFLRLAVPELCRVKLVPPARWKIEHECDKGPKDRPQVVVAMEFGERGEEPATHVIGPK